MGTSAESNVHIKHEEEPALPHGGYLAEKAQVMYSGTRRLLGSWWSYLFGPRALQQDKKEEKEGPAVRVAEPGALVPDPTKEKLPLGQQVVNAVHSVVEHLGQEAAAVSSTLKDEADDLRGIHPLHTNTTEETHAQTVSPTPAGGEEGTAPHMSVASQLKNAVHSTLDHLGQETEAVSGTVKQELQEFQHPHTAGRAA